MSEEASSARPALGDSEETAAPDDSDHKSAEPTMSGVRHLSPAPAAASPSAALSELRADEVLGGKYRLLKPLGEGGMGSVWVAHSETLDIRVAVKVIRTDIEGGDKTRIAERLLQEARAAARLGHPAIVRISDFGKTPLGNPFIVMELLEGEDLGAAMQRRGRMACEIAARTLLPIGHALAAAHDKGIIHRDLKPENILLAIQEDGSVQPKLIDFGIAKVENQPNERITAAGAVMGSPGYLSPEQARGDDVDARSDVWSFCVVMYEMVTGELPFTGKNSYALLRAIIEEDVKPLREHGVLDDALWTILARGLTKDPAKRWPSMRSLGVALASWLLDQGITEDICGSSLESAWIRKRDRNSLPDSGSNPRFSMSGRTPIPDREATTLESGPQVVPRASEVPPAAPHESEAPRPAKPAWPMIAIGAVALIGLGGYWLTRGGSESPQSTSAAAGITGAAAPEPPPLVAPPAVTVTPADTSTAATPSASTSAEATPSAKAKAQNYNSNSQAKPPVTAKAAATAAPASTPTGPGLKKPTF